MSRLKKGFYDVLKGGFLTREDSFKNWRFILFMVVLMLLMIASAHSSDKKVMEIARLNKEVKELRAEFVDTRSIVMKLKVESSIRNKVAEMGLKPGTTPPQVIKVIPKTKE